MSSSADAAYLIYLKIYDKRYSHTQQIIIKDNKDVKFIKLKTTISDVCKIIYNFNYNNYDKYIYFHKLFKILYILQSEEYDIYISHYDPNEILNITVLNFKRIENNFKYFNNLKRYLKSNTNLYFTYNTTYLLYIFNLFLDKNIYFNINYEKFKFIKNIIYIIFLIHQLNNNFIKLLNNITLNRYCYNNYNNSSYLVNYALSLMNRYSNMRHSWLIAVYKAILNRYKLI